MTSDNVKGTDAVKGNMDKAQAQILRAIEAGMYLATNNIAVTSMRNTPVDFGVLKGSHYVTLPQHEGGNIRVEIGVGGPAASYAVKVHELDRPHKVGESKFLEKAIHQHAGGIQEEVRQLATRAMSHLGAEVQMPTGVVPKTPNEGPKRPAGGGK